MGLSRVDEPLSIRIVRTAIDRGINFMDNSWDYNNGESETRMGKALRDGYRDKVFLMTKIDGRSKKEAARQLEESLRQLNTDHIDLVQHHEILRFEDPHRIFDEDGANAALLEAKQVGKVRYIGFTGHKDPRIHLYMLEVATEYGFKFDTVQMPLNVMDAHYRSFGKLVVGELVKQKIGILGMKPMADRSDSEIEHRHAHRVFALRAQLAHLRGNHWHRQHGEILDQACEAVRTFRPLSEPQLKALLAKTAKAASSGEFEPFKTTSLFDSTAQNPAWLGEESQRVKEMAPMG